MPSRRCCGSRRTKAPNKRTSIGEDVTEFKVGDAVYGNASGACAEYDRPSLTPQFDLICALEFPRMPMSISSKSRALGKAHVDVLLGFHELRPVS